MLRRAAIKTGAALVFNQCQFVCRLADCHGTLVVLRPSIIHDLMSDDMMACRVGLIIVNNCCYYYTRRALKWPARQAGSHDEWSIESVCLCQCVSNPAATQQRWLAQSCSRSRQCCCQGLETQGRGQGRGLENWSSMILEDKDFPRGQQHCCVRHYGEINMNLNLTGAQCK